MVTPMLVAAMAAAFWYLGLDGFGHAFVMAGIMFLVCLTLRQVENIHIDLAQQIKDLQDEIRQLQRQDNV
jgi:hypothetical protein